VPEAPGVPGSGDAGLRAANTRLRELLAERDAEIAALRDLVTALQLQVADLAAQVKTNSRNSSKPPSSDGPAKPSPKSLRGKSGRKPGRPEGQPGATMELSEHPDKKVKHRPAKCGCCGKSLRNAPVTAVERRQVIGVPPVKTVTTEHQMLTVKCGCGCETKAPSPDGVNAPVQYGPRIIGTGIYLWHGQFLSRDRACQALSDMFGCAPSPGALAAAARKAAGFLAPTLQAITRHSPPDRCAAASSGASPAIPGNRRSPRVTASSNARQSPAGVPDGAAGRAASWPDTAGSRPASRSRNTAAREVNRDRHDRAVDAGTLRRASPPGTAACGRAGTRPAAAACAASTSTAWITAAPYRRRDHRPAGSSTCVGPQSRHRPRRGRNPFGFSAIAISRHRA